MIACMPLEDFMHLKLTHKNELTVKNTILQPISPYFCYIELMLAKLTKMVKNVTWIAVSIPVISKFNQSNVPYLIMGTASGGVK